MNGSLSFTMTTSHFRKMCFSQLIVLDAPFFVEMCLCVSYRSMPEHPGHNNIFSITAKNVSVIGEKKFHITQPVFSFMFDRFVVGAKV